MARFSNAGGSGDSADLIVPVSIKDNNGYDFINFEKTGTGTARIETTQDDLSLRSARDITLFAGSDGPGNVYIGWGDAVYTPDSPNRVATIGDIQAASNTVDVLYTTHNSDGTNVKIGDDAWIGDVDAADHIAVIGVQDPLEGGVIFGSQKTATITGNDTSLDLHAFSNINISADAAPGWINLSAYEGAYVNGTNDPLNKVATFRDLQTVTPKAYGAFSDHTTFGPYAANSEQALSYQTTDFSSDVHIGGINSSEIVVDKAGIFNIQFSTQFHSTSGGAIVYIWLKKNGTTMPWTGTRFDITANNPYAVAAWNWFVQANQYDSFEIFWSTPSNSIKVEAITGLTGTKSSVPSNIVTVAQVA